MSHKTQLANMQLQNKQLRERIEAARKRDGDPSLFGEASGVAPVGSLSIGLRATLRGHEGKVFSIAWNPNSRTLLSTSQDERMVWWNSLSRTTLHTLLFPSSFALSCCYHPTDRIALAGGVYSNISVVGLDASGDVKIQTELKSHSNYVSSLAFVNRKQFISSGDKTVLLWDLEHEKKVLSFKNHIDYVMEVCPAPDGSTFLSGGCDKTAILWDMQTGRPGYVFSGHEGTVNGVHFFPTGMSFATACDDGKCYFWDVRSNRCLCTFTPGGPARAANSVNFSMSGRVLFAGYESGYLVGYDVLKGDKVLEVKAAKEEVRKVRVSPDGMALATCGDNEIKIWS